MWQKLGSLTLGREIPFNNLYSIHDNIFLCHIFSTLPEQVKWKIVKMFLGQLMLSLPLFQNSLLPGPHSWIVGVVYFLFSSFRKTQGTIVHEYLSSSFQGFLFLFFWFSCI